MPVNFQQCARKKKNPFFTLRTIPENLRTFGQIVKLSNVKTKKLKIILKNCNYKVCNSKACGGEV